MSNGDEEDYDSDDATIQDLGVNLGTAYCTECKKTYDVTTESDAHAH